MLPDAALEVLNRPDWVLHLPPTPVNTRACDFSDLSYAVDDRVTKSKSSSGSAGKRLKKNDAESDGSRLGVDRLDASESSFYDPEDFDKFCIRRLNGVR